MAKLIEDKIIAAHSLASHNPTICSLPPSLTVATSSSQNTPSQNNRLPIKHLTLAKMAPCQEKGLLFNSDEKFVPGHRCTTPKFLCLITEDDEEIPPTV